MDKKKIIIVIVVFLLLGTMVYSFASPRTGDEQLEGNDPPTEEQGGNQDDDDQDDDQTQGNEDDDQTDDDQDDDTLPVDGDNNNNDDNNNQNIDYYQLALDAVSKAEDSLKQNDVDAAKDAIDKVTGDVSDLVGRVENVQNIIDFESLLKQLEDKTNSSKNKDQLDSAREFNTTEKLAEKLNNLVDNKTKDQLEDRYNTVSAKLNDTTAPVVNGIKNGDYTKGPVSLTITDNSSFTATLSKDGGEGINYITGTEITEDGEYTLTVIDNSFNEIIIKFTVENVKPEVINISQVYEDKEDGRIKVTITTSEEIFGDLLGNSEWRKVSGKNEYYNYYYETQEVTINFQDKAGNEGTYTFTVDMTKPTAEVTMSNNNGNTSTNKDVTVTLVASEDILDIEGWTKVDSRTFTKEFTENVKNYQVEITDLVGNKNTITFEVKRIDKVPPVLTVIEPNNYNIEVNTPYVEKGYSAYDAVDKDLTDRVTMTYQFLPKGSGNWQVVDGIDTSVLGSYVVTYTVSDKAGNIAEKTRAFDIVDSSLPVITVKEESKGTIEEKIFSNVSFKLYDKHLIDKVVINGVEKTLTNNSWSDLNNVSVGQNGGVYGENTLVLFDVYGNKTEYKFVLDNKVPQLAPKDWTVTIEAAKDATFTCPDMTAYGSDEYGVKSVVLDQYFNDHLTNVDVTKPGKFVCRYITTDKAGNSAANDITYNVVDTTAPVFNNLIDGTVTNDYVSLVVTDLDFDYILITNNDTNYSWKETRDWTSFHLEGNYTVVAYDKSGNASESYTFTIDKTSPTLGAANILVSGDVNEQEVFYATYGDKINVYVRFNEELKHNPTFTLINNGKKYVIADEDVVVRSFDDGQYQYSILFEITEDVDMTDGEITMLVSNIEDLAGNRYADITEPSNGHRVYLDRTLEYNTLGIAENDPDENPKYVTNGDSIRVLVYFKEELAVLPKVRINGVEYDTYYASQSSNPENNSYAYHLDLPITEKLNLEEGTINFEVYGYEDKAGNKGVTLTNDDITYEQFDKVVYDNTSAIRIYSTVDFDGTGITPKVEGTRKTYYVNNGTSFVFRMQFTEQLSENPILNVGNKTVELELVEKFVINEGKYIYQGTVEINEEDNFADGSLPLILSNVKDLAGNVTLDEAVLNQTITSNDRTVVIDNTPSTAKPLYILARDDANYRLSISDGEYLRVEANFNEELSKKPILTVGSQSIEFDRCNFNSDETRYVCVADIKIDNSIARLVEGKNIPFTVTNIYDLAGNSSELNNDDVTDYYRGNELVYSNVKFENPFVSMSFHNSTNYKLNEENNNTDLSVTEAKVGDTVRVFVRFNQDIDIENFKPTIVIGGVAKELNLSNIYNDGTKDYGADITITKEMNLKFNEEIPFVIKNIVLKNGNNLPNLSQDDITSTNLSGVIYIGE